MIPLRDTARAGNYPVVNNILIGINVVVFLFQLSQGADGDLFIYIFGLVPARYSNPQIGAYFSTFYQLFSCARGNSGWLQPAAQRTGQTTYNG